MVASVAAMLNLLKGLWFDGELYKFHRWFHMIYILIMQLRGASFILRMKSRVLLHSEVGMIMVSICLHGVISWSQASGRGRFGPKKSVIAEKYHPSVLKFCLTWTVCNISNKMTKFYDDVYSFEPVMGCQFLKLYISMFEKWLESPQWLLAVSKPKVRMRVTSAWGQEFRTPEAVNFINTPYNVFYGSLIKSHLILRKLTFQNRPCRAAHPRKAISGWECPMATDISVGSRMHTSHQLTWACLVKHDNHYYLW